jgi:Fe2+ transport system protein FeoA
LNDLQPGDRAVVKGCVMQQQVYERLSEMGLIEGTIIELVRVAPLGDPLQIKLRGYNLSLRTSEARHIQVEKIAF